MAEVGFLNILIQLLYIVVPDYRILTNKKSYWPQIWSIIITITDNPVAFHIITGYPVVKSQQT